jgi:murein DD-endopeptidase MepM/ murein hydrolase activator NlpD
MWRHEHAWIDRRFGGEPHRTEVAHFVWGDRVHGSGNEDLVFTTRRRLIELYADFRTTSRPTALGIPFVSPLDGSPRVATSGPGEDRDGGLRRHRGLDIAALEGEPVRAIADGEVIFAGVSLAGSDGPLRHGPIAPEQIARYRKRPLGVGGIYLCIRHEISPREVVSCYMHLDSYVVAEGTAVQAGQLVGYVGRTGVKQSPAHLHIEVRVDDRAENPMRYLTAWVIPPQATKTYRHMLAARRARLLTNTR